MPFGSRVPLMASRPAGKSRIGLTARLLRPIGIGTTVGPTMADRVTLKIQVDRSRCQGHNRCYALAPELFEIDDHGFSKEAGDGAVPAGLEAKARLAVANCPEHAVRIVSG